MNIGKYKNSIYESLSLLRSFELLGDVNYHYLNCLEASKFLSSKAIQKQNNYYEYYRFLVEEGLYDFNLIDNSIFQFSFDHGILRYAFYPNVDAVSYEEFLIQLDLNYQEVGETFREDYDIFLMQETNSLQRVCVRYDYSVLEYKEACHSVSHLHFGSEKTLRIDSAIVFTPMMFVLFVLKNYYYKVWEKNYLNHPALL